MAACNIARPPWRPLMAGGSSLRSAVSHSFGIVPTDTDNGPPGSTYPGLARQRLANAERTAGVSHGPIYEAVLAAALPLARERVLDFGAGTGAVAARLAAEPLVTESVAADIVPPAAPPPPGTVQWITADLNEPLALDAHQFDLITAVEVIEHLENPRATAREWLRLLKPGGSLVMSTPNVESIRSLLALVFRGHFLAFTEPSYPAHITALTSQDVTRVLREAGFAEIRIRYSNVGRVPKFAFTWQHISLGALRGRRFSDNLIAVARAP